MAVSPRSSVPRLVRGWEPRNSTLDHPGRWPPRRYTPARAGKSTTSADTTRGNAGSLPRMPLAGCESAGVVLNEPLAAAPIVLSPRVPRPPQAKASKINVALRSHIFIAISHRFLDTNPDWTEEATLCNPDDVDLVHAERCVWEAEACVSVQVALVDLFKRERCRGAFFSALTMLDTVRAEREAARASLRAWRKARLQPRRRHLL